MDAPQMAVAPKFVVVDQTQLPLPKVIAVQFYRYDHETFMNLNIRFGVFCRVFRTKTTSTVA